MKRNLSDLYSVEGFRRIPILSFVLLLGHTALSQPNWPAIKNNATFLVADTSYATPYIQPINLPGWEDGLYITRDGKHLFSTYLPLDAFSWLLALGPNPLCFDFTPYFRPPLLDIDTITNSFGCKNYIHSDIIIASRTSADQAFSPWQSSNLKKAFSFDGAAQGVLLNKDVFDVFVYSQDVGGTQREDILFLKNAAVNPSQAGAVPILSSPAQEDNPHLERLDDHSLILLFDRDRRIYYSRSTDNGTTWQSPVLITRILNDQAPYDVQPHLWNDGVSWWVYFCADGPSGKRGIYKSKQLINNDWDSWGPKELVIEGGSINGGDGTIVGVGEPSLTQWGDLSFVVVYADLNSKDNTNVYDADPWYLPKKKSLITGVEKLNEQESSVSIFPNPTSGSLTFHFRNGKEERSYQIYNSLGEKVKEFTANPGNELDVSELPPGVYFLHTSKAGASIKFLKK